MSADKKTSQDAIAIPTNPAVQCLLPLLYIVWADGELNEQEIKSIRSKLTGPIWCSDETSKFLSTWLQPDAPPSATQIQSLRLAIQKSFKNFPKDRKLSLLALGQVLAGTSIPASKLDEEQSDIHTALEEIEQLLGIFSQEAAAELLAYPAQAPDLTKPGEHRDSLPLQKILDGSQVKFRNRIRRLLSQPEFAYSYGSSVDEYREQVYKWCKLLAQEGLGRIAYPVLCGGEGDTEKSIVFFEMLAFHDISLLIKYGVQFGLFGGSINMLGTDRHHLDYLPQIGSLELPGCFAMTELGHGSNVAGIETTATYDPADDCFVIHTPHDQACKQYIGNAACHAQLATVFAQLLLHGASYGVHAFLVPIRDALGNPSPGVKIEDTGIKMGLNGVDNGRLHFEQVRVPRKNLLNRFADVDEGGSYRTRISSPAKRFFTTLSALVTGRVCIAWGSLSASKSGLTIAVRYGQKRRQFGPPGDSETRLLDYRTHQRRLLPPLAAVYALDFALKSLTQRVAGGTIEDRREDEALTAGLKAYCSWLAIDILQTCRECCGGQGYLSVNRFASLRNDLEIFTTFEGDNTVLMQLLAKGLLTDYSRQFEDMRTFTIVKFITSKAETVVSELNPVITRTTSEDHLRDSKFQMAAFTYREQQLLATATRRLRHRITNGMSSHDAFHDCQDHLVTLAHARVELVVLETFIDGVQQAGPDTQPVLKLLCDMYALSRLEADRGWFLESGYIAGSKSKAIRNQVNKLCSEIRPHATALVNAFGIPDAILSAPIANC